MASSYRAYSTTSSTKAPRQLGVNNSERVPLTNDQNKSLALCEAFVSVVNSKTI